jgi:hypothetical protein
VTCTLRPSSTPWRKRHWRPPLSPLYLSPLWLSSTTRPLHNILEFRSAQNRIFGKDPPFQVYPTVRRLGRNLFRHGVPTREVWKHYIWHLYGDRNFLDTLHRKLRATFDTMINLPSDVTELTDIAGAHRTNPVPPLFTPVKGRLHPHCIIAYLKISVVSLG